MAKNTETVRAVLKDYIPVIFDSIVRINAMSSPYTEKHPNSGAFLLRRRLSDKDNFRQTVIPVLYS